MIVCNDRCKENVWQWSVTVEDDDQQSSTLGDPTDKSLYVYHMQRFFNIVHYEPLRTLMWCHEVLKHGVSTVYLSMIMISNQSFPLCSWSSQYQNGGLMPPRHEDQNFVAFWVTLGRISFQGFRQGVDNGRGMDPEVSRMPPVGSCCLVPGVPAIFGDSWCLRLGGDVLSFIIMVHNGLSWWLMTVTDSCSSWWWWCMMA